LEVLATNDVVMVAAELSETKSKSECHAELPVETAADHLTLVPVISKPRTEKRFLLV
jgi:hypothetical protein